MNKKKTMTQNLLKKKGIKDIFYCDTNKRQQIVYLIVFL